MSPKECTLKPQQLTSWTRWATVSITRRVHIKDQANSHTETRQATVSVTRRVHIKTSTLQCPSHSCRNPQESTGIHRNPQESSGMALESSGMAPESAGILRNPQEWDRNRTEMQWNGIGIELELSEIRYNTFARYIYTNMHFCTLWLQGYQPFLWHWYPELQIWLIHYLPGTVTLRISTLS